MHKFELPQSLIDMSIGRSGKPHVFSDIDPEKTALIVVDMQNGYLVEEHSAVYVPEAESVVPNINEMAKALRSAGGKVYWIRNTISPETKVNWSNWIGMYQDVDGFDERSKNLYAGSFGHEVFSGLEVLEEDEVVFKERYSAFIQGASSLDEQLRAKGIDTVVIVGTLTNVCCESSARDAMMLNYKVIMVSDGNATLSDELHEAALINCYSTFGDVMTTKEFVGFLSEAKQTAE